ncbi:hypothetical protein VDGL01_07570 [Verticillium dahliae]|nr:hypothetical protein VD0003_g1653 [Verticillium dahliae]
MAELVGLIASSLALAEFGARLSLQLYTLARTLARTLASAPADARALASDMSLTATVARELAAVAAARTAVGDCLAVFGEVDALLGQSLARMRGGRGGRAVERVRWALGRERLEGLRDRLERLKAGLGLMLQVLGYARDVKGRAMDEEEKAYRRRVIGSLALLEREMAARGGDNGLPPYEQDGGTFGALGTASPPRDEQGRPKVAGELLLGCKLLEQLVAAEPRPEIPTAQYAELAGHLRRLEQGEAARLAAASGGVASSFDTSEAVKRLHERLIEVAGPSPPDPEPELERSKTHRKTPSPEEKPPLTRRQKEGDRAAARPSPRLGAALPPFRPPLDDRTRPFTPYSPAVPYELASPGYSTVSPSYSPVDGSPYASDAMPPPQHITYSEVIFHHPSTRSGEQSYTHVVEASFGGFGEEEDEVDIDVPQMEDEEFDGSENDSKIVNELLAKWTTIGAA